MAFTWLFKIMKEKFRIFKKIYTEKIFFKWLSSMYQNIVKRRESFSLIWLNRKTVVKSLNVDVVRTIRALLRCASPR